MKNINNTIFIQIASYKDSELIPTISDLIQNAKYPDNLTFGICLQDTREEITRLIPLLPKNSRIKEVEWHNSKGLCWARSEIQRLYQGEKWTLQLDSHHRVVPDWDEKLINMYESLEDDRAILTAYAVGYDPETNMKHKGGPYKMVASWFTDSGTIMFFPQEFSEDDTKLNRPIPARFISGHFFFTKGEHCIEYKYDPSLYFAGDEISLSIRSFTLGWNIYHPHENIIYHEYTRAHRVKHWDDHISNNNVTPWHETDKISKKRLRKMLREEDNDSDITGFDIGTVRTHSDYERYAGINFAKKALHKDTIAGIMPPVTFTTDDDWTNSFLKTVNITVEWDFSDINQCDDLQFCYFGFEDKQGNTLLRKDFASDSDVATGTLNKTTFSVTYYSSPPTKLVIWPYSKSKEWLQKKEIAVI